MHSAGAVSAWRGYSTIDEDTHDDFKPQVKTEAPSSLVDQIESDVKSHDVFIYMKVRSRAGGSRAGTIGVQAVIDTATFTNVALRCPLR